MRLRRRGRTAPCPRRSSLHVRTALGSAAGAGSGVSAFVLTLRVEEGPRRWAVFRSEDSSSIETSWSRPLTLLGYHH